MRRYKGEKGKAWDACRAYICERDRWKCSTCPSTKEQGYQMQAGHYQPVGLVGSNNALSWDEENIYCQCARCNGVGQGQQERMAEHIRRAHGEEVLQSLKDRVHKVDSVKDWVAMTEYYKNKLKELHEQRRREE